MECLENEFVCSVRKENDTGYYRIHTIWKNDGFRINIASKNGAWSGEMTPDTVKDMSNELRVEPSQYLSDCKEVLSTDDGKQGYSYSVENGCFTWKKLIDEDTGIKVRMGSVMLHPVSYEDTVQNIIEVSLKCKKNLQKQLHSLIQEKNKEHQRVNDLQEKIEEVCFQKNIMETDLYNKFLMLLNSKKRKIKELEAKLINNSMLSKKLKDNPMSEAELNEAYEMETEDEDGMENIKLITSRHPVNLQESVSCSSDIKNRLKDKYTSTLNNSNLKKLNSTNNEGTCMCNCTKYLENKCESGENTKINNALPATKADILDFFFGSKQNDNADGIPR